ncbi:MAG TPA: neuraminidase-like domain-containing protein, partial [Kofleriaceae bacterium]|nr:neuraminidase-like domain-containing protein [Kofleriaceae bacterium]
MNEILERYLKDVVPFDDTTALYRHLAEDDHSFGQPFTLPLVRLGVLLEHFGVTRYDVAKAMQAGRAAQARARLGLSLKDYQLITTERQDDAGFLLKLFRITSDVTAPNAILAPVEMASLVRAIGLPHDTVASVLHTEFVAVTGAEAPPVEIVLGKRDPGDVQNNSEMVTNLTLRRLDRVHRFVRLWRTLSWTIDELDYVLARLVTPWPVAWIIPDNTDAMGTLEQIVKQLDVNAGWQLPVDELLALTDEFPARGLREATSLFDRLFNQPAFVGRDGVWGPQLAGRFTHPSWTKAIVGGEPDSPVGHSIPADNTLLRLLAGLQLSDAELVELVAGLRSLEAIDYRPAGENGAESIALSRASIGALYRHARLRRLLGCSVADFLRILRLAPFVSRGSRPIEFIRSIDDVRCAVEFAAWQRTSGFTLDEIRYLIDATTKGELDPAGLAAQIVASAKAEHSLEFADTLFTQLELTEAQSRELVAINVSRAAGDGLPFESSLGAYRVRAGGTAGLVIPAALATRVDAAAVRGLLEGHGALHVLDVALGRALGRPLDEVAVLRAIAEPPAQLDTAAIARAIQGGAASADTDRLVTLIARMARFQVLLRSAVFDLAGLQFVAAAPAVLFGATAAAPLTTTPAITLDVVRNVAAYVALAAATDTGFTTASGPADLAAIRRVVVEVGAASDADLAHALRTDESRIGALRPHLALPDGMFDALAAIDRCLAIAKQLGVSGETLRLLVEESTPSAMFDGLARAAEDVFGAFRAKYPDERTFADKLEPFDDKLRARKRDGLVDYLVTGLATPFADPSKLYEYFLIDVMVEGCARTSRVVAATSSLQLYVHRVLMNLERSRDWDPMDTTNTGVRAHFTSADKRSEWQWRQHYRVWEANRRVFLYPENYLEPELRDDKTPLFEDLEDSLLLQEIDKASVHDAYSRYL